MDRDKGCVSVEWPDEKRGPWRVTFDMGLVDDRWECVSVEMRIPPGRRRLEPINSVLWRQIPIGRLTGVALAAWLKQLRTEDNSSFETPLLDAVSDDPVYQQAVSNSLRRQRDALGSRERGISRRDIATVYSAATRGEYIDRSGRVLLNPLEAVQTEFGLKTRNAAAQHVKKARQAGLLPPTTSGRPRGGTR